MNRAIVLSTLFLLGLTGCFFNDDARVIKPPPTCEEVEKDPESLCSECEVPECPEVPVCQGEELEFSCEENVKHRTSKFGGEGIMVNG